MMSLLQYSYSNDLYIDHPIKIRKNIFQEINLIKGEILILQTVNILIKNLLICFHKRIVMLYVFELIYQSFIQITQNLALIYKIIQSMYKRSEPATRDPFTHQYKESGDRRKFSSNDQIPTHKSNLNLDLQAYINDKKFIDVLKRKGIKNLFKIQAATFNFIHQGRDIIARDRTGSGKTLAFTLPVLQKFREKHFDHKYPKMLVILPTRQLAIQVNNQILSLRYSDCEDFQTMVVYGKSNIMDNISRLQRGTDILVGTPGRLNDLIQRQAIRLDNLQVLVLDQADEMLKQGFQEQVEKILSAIKKVNNRKVQTLLFSATIPEWIHNLSNKYQQNAKYINMIDDQQIRTSKDITHCAIQVSNSDQGQVVKILQEMINKYGGYEKRVLIFCQKKMDVDNLSRQLRMQNAPLHGDVAQFKREKAYHAFKNGSLRCIVATNVAARGLDFPSVDLVVQMCPPMNTEDYIHRAGRTGRAGKKGTCLTFFEKTKSRLIWKIENQAKIKMQKVRFEGPRGGYSNQNRQRQRSPPQRQRYDSGNNKSYPRDNRDSYQQQNGNSNRYQSRNDNRSNYNSSSNRDPRNRQDYQKRDNYYDNRNSNRSNRDQVNEQKSYNKYSQRQRQTPSDFKRSPIKNSNKGNSSCSRSLSKSKSKSPQRRQQKRFSHSKNEEKHYQQKNNNNYSSSKSKNQSDDVDY